MSVGLTKPECAMLRPLMLDSIPVSLLRHPCLDELFNLPDWQVSPVADWTSLLERLASKEAIFFASAKSGKVRQLKEVPIADMRSELCLRSNRDLCVGFTPSGGSLWDRTVQVDWRELVLIEPFNEQRAVLIKVGSDKLFSQFEQYGQLVDSSHEIAVVTYWGKNVSMETRTLRMTALEFDRFMSQFPWRMKTPRCGSWSWSS